MSGKAALPNLATRLALRPKEAAEALGISERKLRELVPELPHVRRRGVLLFPVESLRAWLAGTAKAESQAVRIRPRGRKRADSLAREVLEDLGR